MKSFEVIKVVFSGVVVTVAFDSASWKSAATLEVTILAKKKKLTLL